MMRGTIFIVIWVATLGIDFACAKKQPASKPVVVEDVIPFGTPVCFPNGMKNPSDQPGAAEATTSPLRTNDFVPEVFRAPTTQPTSFSDEERAWVVNLNQATTAPGDTTLLPEVINAPTTRPTTQAMLGTAHGGLNHWCALCAAAAQRAAEQGRTKPDLITPDADLLIELPPR